MFKYIKYTKVETDTTVLEFRGGDDTIKVNYFTGVSAVSVESENEADIDTLIDAQASEIKCEEITQDEFKVLVSSTSQVKRILDVASAKLALALQDIKIKYPQEERETWAIQKEEAFAYKADNDADTPFLKSLADAKGITIDDLATAILDNNSKFMQLSAKALSDKQVTQKEMLSKIGL